MFAIEVIGPMGQISRLTVDTFEKALAAYADQAWDDPPHILLGRTVIVRDIATCDVWAVGSYRPSPKSYGLPAVLTFLRRRQFTAVVISFMLASNGKVLRRDHEVADDLLLPE
jgi:hypothetical protein